MKVKPKSPHELKLMRKSGLITAKALIKTLEAVKAGVSLIELDDIAREEILRLGGNPSFMSVPGYEWTTCLTVNDEVVHGIPRDVILKDGDVLGIDLGAVYQGYHTDAAWSILVSEEGRVKSEESEKKERFLEVGEKALWDGIKQAVEGNKIGDISEAIQSEVERRGGYSVVRSLVGHGVGKNLHEEPEVPGFGKAGTGLKLMKNMTLAIEAIYTEGKSGVVMDSDGWTIRSEDGTLGGLFEMSIIVLKDKAEVLTDWRGV